MTHRAFAEKLEQVSKDISSHPLADLQILLRQAAIRVRNVNATVTFRDDIEKAVAWWARETGTSRDHFIEETVRQWLEGMGTLPWQDLDHFDRPHPA